LGHFYPTPPQDVCAIISAVQLSRMTPMIAGFVLPGDMLMSMRPYRGLTPLIYDYDKVTLTWVEGLPQDGETVQADPSGVDYLLNVPITLASCYGINRLATTSTEAIVSYVQNTDFTLSGNAITWISANRPVPGEPFTVRYTCQPEWILFMPPMVRYERATNLGQAAILRKRSVVLGKNMD
jgi:hypothetical protein